MVTVMRIGVISDLHIDRYNNTTAYIPEFEKYLAEAVRKQELDMLLIAGDISNNFDITALFVRKIKALTKREVYFIPGNHDLWGQDHVSSTHHLLKAYEEMPECLVRSPLVLNEDWAVVGHPAWYDYSYASDKFSYERLARRAYYGGTWQDKLNVDWKMSDPEASKYFSEIVERDLSYVQDKNIILMTHIVTHKRFRVPMPHRLFDYYNAFIGTSDLDALQERYNIKYSIMGHVHFRHQINERGTTYICPCLGYKREWRTSIMANEIEDALFVFEI